MLYLESLPDELFLELFDYLNGVDILTIFYGLNSRFNHLLYQQYHHYHLQFDATSKRHFDIVIQQHLPCIANRVKTLYLSNYEDTPLQVDVFLSHCPSFDAFTYLHVLCISYIQSYSILSTILNQCRRLPYLIGFKVDSCSLAIDQADFQSFINRIWSLPKLVYVLLDIINTNEPWSWALTTISVTLKYVIVYRKSFELNELNTLRRSTPRLKHLSVPIEPSLPSRIIELPFTSLIRLNMRLYESSGDLVMQLLKNTPNLQRLAILLLNHFIDGRQWERIIREDLQKLRSFELRMKGTLCNNGRFQEHLNRLFHSFESEFWITDRRWFIRCLTWDTTVQLNTLPSKSSSYERMIPDSRKSTDPQDGDEQFYSNLTNIYDENFFNRPILSSVILSKIKDLHIKLPINERFWSMAPSLPRLRSLTVLSHNDTFHAQLQQLLDRTSRLETLTISQDDGLPFQASLCNYTCASIREVDLQKLNYHLDDDECIRLSNSPLGIRCHILAIAVQNRTSIVTLVQRMRYLKTLKVNLVDDHLREKPSNDTVIDWLNERLSPACLVTRHADNADTILVWT